MHRDQQYFQSAMTDADRALDIARETGIPGLESQAIYARAELNRPVIEIGGIVFRNV